MGSAVYLPGFAGAPVLVPDKTECVADPTLLDRTNRTTKLIDVHVKMIADQVVRRGLTPSLQSYRIMVRDVPAGSYNTAIIEEVS